MIYNARGVMTRRAHTRVHIRFVLRAVGFFPRNSSSRGFCQSRVPFTREIQSRPWNSRTKTKYKNIQESQRSPFSFSLFFFSFFFVAFAIKCTFIFSTETTFYDRTVRVFHYEGLEGFLARWTTKIDLINYFTIFFRFHWKTVHTKFYRSYISYLR